MPSLPFTQPGIQALFFCRNGLQIDIRPVRFAADRDENLILPPRLTQRLQPLLQQQTIPPAFEEFFLRGDGVVFLSFLQPGLRVRM